jgi:hypothetical protein
MWAKALVNLELLKVARMFVVQHSWMALTEDH